MRARRRGASPSPPPIGQRAAAKGQPWALARAARAEGFVAADDAFAAAFEQALRRHEATPDTFERARSELAYGERLRRARRRGDARAHLRAAFAALPRSSAPSRGPSARGSSSRRPARRRASAIRARSTSSRRASCRSRSTSQRA